MPIQELDSIPSTDILFAHDQHTDVDVDQFIQRIVEAL